MTLADVQSGFPEPLKKYILTNDRTVINIDWILLLWWEQALKDEL